MDGIRKAGTKCERIGQEHEKTIFIPNNPHKLHLIYSQGLFLSDKGNSLGADYCTELEYWANSSAPWVTYKLNAKETLFYSN